MHTEMLPPFFRGGSFDAAWDTGSLQTKSVGDVGTALVLADANFLTQAAIWTVRLHLPMGSNPLRVIQDAPTLELGGLDEFSLGGRKRTTHV